MESSWSITWPRRSACSRSWRTPGVIRRTWTPRLRSSSGVGKGHSNALHLHQRGLRQDASDALNETMTRSTAPPGFTAGCTRCRRPRTSPGAGPPPGGRSAGHGRASLQHHRSAPDRRHGMVVPRFVRQAIEGRPLTVYGDAARCVLHERPRRRGALWLWPPRRRDRRRGQRRQPARDLDP